MNPKFGHEEVKRFRDDVWMVPGHDAAARRISVHRAVSSAWNSLDLFPIKAVDDYLGPSLDAAIEHAAVRDKATDDEIAELRSRLAHVVVAFALTAVEAERERVVMEPAVALTEPVDEGRERESEDIPF